MVKVNTKLFTLLAMCAIFRCTYSITDSMKPSVAFVIDDTASMEKVIEEVKEKAEDIFRTIYQSKASIIGDFILVTFNDYEVFKDESIVIDYAREPVKVRTVTRDPAIFLQKLDEIIVEGGGECPEMCLSGIYVAMEKCNPNSYIYVFTDSSSKDYHLKQAIENLAQQKSVQITFLLTKGNRYCTIEDDTLFRNISKATSGEVFRINERDISEILDYVSLRIQSPQTSLLTAPIQPGNSNISVRVNFHVDLSNGDQNMKNLTITVSCNNGSIGVNVIGPDGNKAPVDYLVKNLNNIKVLLIQNPASGQYVANIDSDSAGEASVIASTTVDFLHGFSTFDSSPSSMKNTKTKPVPDEESYLAIQLILTGTSDAKVKTIHIIDMNHKELMSMPANVANEKENIYVSAAFKPPNDMFKILIVAVDLKTDEKFIRISRTPIQPQPRPAIRLKYKEPEVTIENSPNIEVQYGDSIKLECKVKAYPKPDIEWEDKETGQKFPSKVSILELPYDYISHLEINNVNKDGVYKCKAISSRKTVVMDEIEVKTFIELPIFDKTNTTSTVEEGSTAFISCRIIKGWPAPTITWEFKKHDANEFVILANTGLDIQIDSVNVDNAGIYRCHAENIVGKDDHEILLTVQYKPSIDKSNSKVTVNLGQQAFISCRIKKGIPEPDISWEFKRKGAADFIVIMETKESHKIALAELENAGVYKCVAKNAVGEDSHEIELIVLHPPRIEKNTKTKTATVGTKAMIECRILEGLPTPIITWEFKRQDANEFVTYKPETEHGINLTSVELDDAGVYKCFANNVVGHDSHEIKFTVTNAPNVIVNKPVTVKIDEQVTLSCEVTGEPKPDVKWIRDGRSIEANAKYIIYRDHSLRFVARSGDEGDYVCEAKNSLGEDSKNATVQIYGPLTIDPPAENPIYVNVGIDVKLPCKASAIPVPEIQWYFFNKEKDVEPRSFQSQKEPLTISKIQENGTGSYSCLVNNGYEIKAITYEVVVTVPVEIEKPVKTEFTIVKNDYVLKIPCKAKGSPKPKVSWLRNFKTKIFTNDDHEVDSDGTLKIKNPNVFSAGNYLCVAESTRSSAFQLFTVHFTSILTRSEPTETIYVEEDKTKEIQCKLPHKSTDTIRWYKDGEEMRQPTNEFIIYRATAFDAGVYSCRVTSFQGSKTAHMRIELGTKPEFENKKDNRIIHTFIEGRKSILDCFAKGKPSPTLTWWHNGIKLKESSDSYTINELNESHLGEYRCEAKNDFDTITRTHVLQKVSGCIINYNEDKGYKFHPVLRTKSGELAHFESKNGVMYIPESEPVECLCPNSIRKFYCVGNQMFLIVETNTIHAEDRKIKYADLKCDNEMKPSEEHVLKGQRCVLDDPRSRLIRIGYKSGEFSALYDVCLNKRTQNRFFIKYDVPRYASNFKIGSHPLATKNCNSQNNFNGKIRRGCCTGRGVVNPEDVSLDTQKATYLNINIVPQWNCSNYVNLDEIDRRIRNLAKSTPRNVVVFGGEFDLNRRARHPKYLWKVVAIRQIDKALAIVTINLPDLTEEEANKLGRAICSDICAYIDWMNNENWHDVTLGYTFCCDPEEFAEKVNPTFKNMFPLNVLDKPV